MKALVINALGRGFDFEDIQIATPMGRDRWAEARPRRQLRLDQLQVRHPDLRRAVAARPNESGRSGFEKDLTARRERWLRGVKERLADASSLLRSDCRKLM